MQREFIQYPVRNHQEEVEKLFELSDEKASEIVKIKVVGVGGAGNNAVNRMMEEGIEGVEYYSVNCDKQALLHTSGRPIQIGEKTTQGFGAGADPEVGCAAAEESIDEIKEALEGADMVFITCGMGGGTGTGAAPVVAKVAKEMGALVVAVVTKPFSYEGDVRMQNAYNGIDNLRNNIDTMVVIPNDKIIEIADRRMTKKEGFKKADEILQQVVQSITELINNVLDVNIDFADVKKVMCNAGVAHVGVGFGSGDEKAMDAVKQAVESKLLETNINNARAVLLNVTAGNYTMYDEQTISEYIVSQTGRSVNLIIGSNDVDDPEMQENCKVVLIATGIDEPLSHSAGRMVNPNQYRNNMRQGQQMGMPQLNRPQFNNNMNMNQQMPQAGMQNDAMVQRGMTGPIRQVNNGVPGAVQDMQDQQQYDDPNAMPSQGVPMGTNNLPRFNNNGVANGGFNASAGTGRIPTKPREQFDIPSFISRSKKKRDE